MNYEMNNWNFVSEAESLEIEDIVRFDHNDRTFCIYLLEDGFYTTDGLCTHESVHLEDGLIIDGEIECPLHQGVFDIKSGKTVSPPPCDNLKTYSTKVDDDKVYIEII